MAVNVAAVLIPAGVVAVGLAFAYAALRRARSGSPSASEICEGSEGDQVGAGVSLVMPDVIAPLARCLGARSTPTPRPGPDEQDHPDDRQDKRDPQEHRDEEAHYGDHEVDEQQ